MKEKKEVIREGDIFNDDSAEIVEVEEEKQKINKERDLYDII